MSLKVEKAFQQSMVGQVMPWRFWGDDFLGGKTDCDISSQLRVLEDEASLWFDAHVRPQIDQSLLYLTVHESERIGDYAASLFPKLTLLLGLCFHASSVSEEQKDLHLVRQVMPLVEVMLTSIRSHFYISAYSLQLLVNHPRDLTSLTLYQVPAGAHNGEPAGAHNGELSGVSGNKVPSLKVVERVLRFSVLGRMTKSHLVHPIKKASALLRSFPAIEGFDAEPRYLVSLPVAGEAQHIAGAANASIRAAVFSRIDSCVLSCCRMSWCCSVSSCCKFLRRLACRNAKVDVDLGNSNLNAAIPEAKLPEEADKASAPPADKASVPLADKASATSVVELASQPVAADRPNDPLTDTAVSALWPGRSVISVRGKSDMLQDKSDMIQVDASNMPAFHAAKKLRRNQDADLAEAESLIATVPYQAGADYQADTNYGAGTDLARFPRGPLKATVEVAFALSLFDHIQVKRTIWAHDPLDHDPLDKKRTVITCAGPWKSNLTRGPDFFVQRDHIRTIIDFGRADMSFCIYRTTVDDFPYLAAAMLPRSSFGVDRWNDLKRKHVFHMLVYYSEQGAYMDGKCTFDKDRL